MRVRTYDEIDPLAAFRLGVVSFGSAWDEAKVRRVRAHDRTYLEEFALYAEERGRVLAQVVPRRLAVRTTNGVEEVGGLAAVCSHPGVSTPLRGRRLLRLHSSSARPSVGGRLGRGPGRAPPRTARTPRGTSGRARELGAPLLRPTQIRRRPRQVGMPQVDRSHRTFARAWGNRAGRGI